MSFLIQEEIKKTKKEKERKHLEEAGTADKRLHCMNPGSVDQRG